jgi:excinuclease ABC subunit C
MREVLTRRFKRLLAEAPLSADLGEPEAGSVALEAVFAVEGDMSTTQPQAELSDPAADADNAESQWPDLVLIDGGQGQLTAATEVLADLGVTVPVAAIAKGPDRDAGRETFFVPGRDSFKLPPRDPVLYFVERLRDEAHRFAVGSHRARRLHDLRESGLQEIAGIGPTRKRALLHHFGTLKAIERASVTDLMQVNGISAETARRIYDFFHEGAA